MKYDKELIKLADVCALLDKSDMELEKRGLRRIDLDNQRQEMTRAIIRNEFMPDVSNAVVEEVVTQFFGDITPKDLLKFIEQQTLSGSFGGRMSPLYKFLFEAAYLIMTVERDYRNNESRREEIQNDILRGFDRAVLRTPQLSPSTLESTFTVAGSPYTVPEFINQYLSQTNPHPEVTEWTPPNTQ